MKRRFAIAMCLVATLSAGTTLFLESHNTAIAHNGALGNKSKEIAVVALGDSISSGQAGRWKGNSNNAEGDRNGTDRAFSHVDANGQVVYKPSMVYGDSATNGCDRSDVAPIMREGIGAQSPHSSKVHHINLACSGAMAKDVYPKAKYNVPNEYLTGPFKGEKPQLEQLADVAKEFHVAFIAISLGSNDIGLGDVARDCVPNYILNGHPCSSRHGDLLRTNTVFAMRNIGMTIDAVRQTLREAGQADDSYRIVLQSSPRLLPPSNKNRYKESGWLRVSEGGCPLWDADTDWINPEVAYITQEMETTAFIKGIDFLNLFDTFQGHEVCSSDSALVTPDSPPDSRQHEWVRFLNTGWSQGTAAESLHPNYFGQIAIGECLRQLSQVPQHGHFACRNTPGEGPEKMKLQLIDEKK